jgi:hypothetical protein
MCKEKMSYHLFIDSNNGYTVTGTETETAGNFYYNIQGFLPDDYRKYYVKMEHILIQHNLGTNNKGESTYIPYAPYIYNVMINFNKGDNIYSSDGYVNVYTGRTEDYERYYYYDYDNSTQEYAEYLNKTALEGRDGQKIIIDKPKNIINIKVVDSINGSIMLDTNTPANDIPFLQMLLTFIPFEEY